MGLLTPPPVLHDDLRILPDKVGHLEGLGRVEDDFALLLVVTGDEEQVVDAGRVVHDRLELVGSQHVPTLTDRISRKLKKGWGWGR